MNIHIGDTVKCRLLMSYRDGPYYGPAWYDKVIAIVGEEGNLRYVVSRGRRGITYLHPREIVESWDSNSRNIVG